MNIIRKTFSMPVYNGHSQRGLTDSQVLVLSKLLACLYGGLLMVMAYLAHFVAGILQVGLTLTGLVGGPMVAVFTLGMFVPAANEAGALASLVSGLVLSLWLNFGGPRPPITNLPSSTSSCSNTTAFFKTTTQSHISVLSKSRPEDYFYLHRLSYWWNVVISCLLALFTGLAVSLITFKRKNITEKDTDLFSPPVAAYFEKNEQKHRNKGVIKYSKNKKDDT